MVDENCQTLNSFLSRPKRKNRKGKEPKKIKTQKQKKYSNGSDKASKETAGALQKYCNQYLPFKLNFLPTHGWPKRTLTCHGYAQ